ncbi:MAG: response regulator transcription factor [Bacteroidales bacterium]|jgi:DNA-binding NarL/FixJ family response regulator|nr:response regulator transcription factor [Bacteroidales bacterium]
MKKDNSQPIRVAIVDDHRIITDGLMHLVEKSQTAAVVGVAYNAADCLDMLAKEQPNVLLLDIGLPDKNGIDVCLEIKEKYPSVKILMLTTYSELSTITRAMDAGADGYVLKNSMPEELLEGIRTLASGKKYICEEAGKSLKENKNSIMALTRREMELLKLIVDGYTLPELADKMCLGVQTIRSYRKNLNIKLDAHNTAQLVKNAKALNLV